MLPMREQLESYLWWPTFLDREMTLAGELDPEKFLPYADTISGSHWRGISSTLSGSDINNVWRKLEGFVTIQTVGEISAAKIFVDGPDTGIDFYVDDFVMDFVEVVTIEPTGGPSKVSSCMM